MKLILQLQSFHILNMVICRKKPYQEVSKRNIKHNMQYFLKDINCNYMKPHKVLQGEVDGVAQQSAWPAVQMAKLSPGKYSGKATGAHVYQIITVICLFLLPSGHWNQCESSMEMKMLWSGIRLELPTRPEITTIIPHPSYFHMTTLIPLIS